MEIYMKKNHTLLLIALTLVALSACSKKESTTSPSPDKKELTISSSPDTSLGAPFDEMHRLYCKEKQNGVLSQTDSIRLAELTMQLQNELQSVTIAIRKEKDADTLLKNQELLIKNQELMIKSAKALNTETCSLGSGNATPGTKESTAPSTVLTPVAPLAPAPLAVVDDSPFTPSFDCAKASNGQEKLVCADRELSRLDVELSQAYSKARDKSTDKNTLKQEQLEWIKYSLRACSDKNCLISTYKKRIFELQ